MNGSSADQARSVYVLALEETIRARHRMLGTGHLLLGLVGLEMVLGTSVAGLGDEPLFDLKAGRTELVKLYPKGCWLSKQVKRSKNVAELDRWAGSRPGRGTEASAARLLRGMLEQGSNTAVWLLIVLGRDVTELLENVRAEE